MHLDDVVLDTNDPVRTSYPYASLDLSQCRVGGVGSKQARVVYQYDIVCRACAKHAVELAQNRRVSLAACGEKTRVVPIEPQDGWLAKVAQQRFKLLAAVTNDDRNFRIPGEAARGALCKTLVQLDGVEPLEVPPKSGQHVAEKRTRLDEHGPGTGIGEASNHRSLDRTGRRRQAMAAPLAKRYSLE